MLLLIRGFQHQYGRTIYFDYKKSLMRTYGYILHQGFKLVIEKLSYKVELKALKINIPTTAP